jgi:hypothetical protein
VRLSALAVLSAATLLPLPLLVLAACPSLGDIGVGSPPSDATAPDRKAPVSDAGGETDAAADVVTCDADTFSDPANCGRCGHDCLEGACSNGACQPVTIYTGDAPVSIIVDGPTLYLVVQSSTPYSGYVFRCTNTSCEASKQVLAANLDFPWFGAKQGSQIYWANFGGFEAGVDPGTVMGCTATGCPDGPTLYSPEGGGVEGGENMSGLAVDGTYLYWVNVSTVVGKVFGALYQCVPSECAGTLTELARTSGFPFVVAVDGSYVYWIDSGLNEVLRCSLPSCGGTPEIFAKISGAPPDEPVYFSGLALYADDVYWTAGVADGGVFTCPKSGCSGGAKTVASNQDDPAFVAVDDSGVYWANSAGGTIMHCVHPGCAKPTVLANVAAPFAIALDAVSVYFTDSSGFGAVLRVAK